MDPCMGKGPQTYGDTEMRNLLAATTLTAALLACTSETGAEPPPPTVPADTLGAFCTQWDAVREAPEARLLEAARRGVLLDNAVVAQGSAQIMRALTWTGEGEPPDPQALPDAILAIGFECDPLPGG